MSKKILVVEDEVIIAEDLKDLIEGLGYSEVDIVFDSEKALDYMHKNRPHLILLDISIKGSLNGIEIAKIINKKYEIPFIYITSHSDKLTLDEAKKTMPYGYIVKPFKEADLFSTLEIALYRCKREKKEEFKIDTINQSLKTNITFMELEVIKDLFLGLTNKQISEKHFISLNTVKTHLKNIYMKLQVNNRSSVIAKINSL